MDHTLKHTITNTLLSDGTILQEETNLRKEIAKKILELREEKSKEALEMMGWINPDKIIHKFEGTSKYWLEHKFIEEVSKLDRGMYEVIIRKVG